MHFSTLTLTTTIPTLEQSVTQKEKRHGRFTLSQPDMLQHVFFIADILTCRKSTGVTNIQKSRWALTVSQRALNQEPETKAAKWNPAMLILLFTLVFFQLWMSARLLRQRPTTNTATKLSCSLAALVSIRRCVKRHFDVMRRLIALQKDQIICNNNMEQQSEAQTYQQAFDRNIQHL